MKEEIRKDFCRVAGKCGGCQLVNMSYDRQLRFKQGYVVKLFGKMCRVEKIVGAENPTHYRNKVSAAFSTTRSGKIVSGIYQSSTHTVVDISGCKIENENADRIINTIKMLVKQFNFSVYDEDRQTGFIRHVMVRCAVRTNQFLVTIVTGTPSFPGKNKFISALLRAHPEITSVVQNINNKKTSMILGDSEKVLYGSGYIEDILCGKRFRISSKSFYQINHDQCERLYEVALKDAGITKDDTIIDAYCGTGTIGIIASDMAKNVYGTEINDAAVKDARINAKINGCDNTKFFTADAKDFMNELAKNREKIDILITDPPRAGCSTDFLKSTVKLAPRQIVYISCNPETQVRDVNFLMKHGYKIKKCTPVDMFPYTKHVETVVLLSQQRPKDKIKVELNMTEMDITSAETEATYQEIKDYILNKHGVKVSSLYIAQVKEKLGLKERKNYNKPKEENAKQPQCPAEKETLIVEALKYFQMI